MTEGIVSIWHKGLCECGKIMLVTVCIYRYRKIKDNLFKIKDYFKWLSITS